MERIYKIRHSLAHLLAASALKIDKNAKFGVGPVIENGFYYDILFSTKVDEDILEKLEDLMKTMIEDDVRFIKKELKISDAIKLFKKLKQKFKLELLEDLKKYGTTDYNEILKIKEKKLKPKKIKTVTIYQTGDFIDLCEGGHVNRSSEIPIDSFKLIKIAGAYWRGDEKKPMLTRIYGIAFETKKELEEYLKRLEEAEKRDHRVLGQKLELFIFDDEVGTGLPLWMPKGATLRKIIEDYLYNELINNGYEFVVTPHIGKLQLWQTSGHWELYRENMYSPIEIDTEKYILKPMNCPFHVKIFQSRVRSYKDLPIKYAEFGTVYRYERSGTLHGLTRVRGFTQDDAHIWCTKEQLKDEVKKLLDHGLRMLRKFGFEEFNIYLSTRPEKYAGTEKGWKFAINVLESVLKEIKINYDVDPGGGVFYGPKIDIKIKDTLGREWQCTTIQVDFNLPEKFNITFVNDKGEKEKPFMIHRALIGSMERFIGVLLEYYKGDLPFWLAPIQIVILPIKKENEDYGNKIYEELKKYFRVKIYNADETLSKRILKAEEEKIPFMVIVGKKEEEEKKISVREHKKGDLGLKKLEVFIKELKELI
ncbi:MAG: threonine--tRNA ligase [Minisyncoccia bacterium]